MYIFGGNSLSRCNLSSKSKHMYLNMPVKNNIKQTKVCYEGGKMPHTEHIMFHFGGWSGSSLGRVTVFVANLVVWELCSQILSKFFSFWLTLQGLIPVLPWTSK